MRRASIYLMTAVVVWMGVIGARCLAHETTASNADDAREIYDAFLTQWMGKDNAKTNVASTATQPTPKDIDQYNECTSGGKGSSTRWTTSTTDADLKSALAPLSRINLVDPRRWQAADPSRLITKGQSVDTAVETGVANGLMTLSAISFNKTHDIAMFTYSFACGSLCGNGGVVMFKKTPRGWVGSKQHCSNWIS